MRENIMEEADLNNSGIPGFCSDCGSVLPYLGLAGGIQCFTCKKCYGPEVYERIESFYTIHFNTYDRGSLKKVSSGAEAGEEGPVVERKCSACGNETMSYATLQLRSADEGQTVFYTCTKCKFKETENS